MILSFIWLKAVFKVESSLEFICVALFSQLSIELVISFVKAFAKSSFACLINSDAAVLIVLLSILPSSSNFMRLSDTVSATIPSLTSFARFFVSISFLLSIDIEVELEEFDDELFVSLVLLDVLLFITSESGILIVKLLTHFINCRSTNNLNTKVSSVSPREYTG